MAVLSYLDFFSTGVQVLRHSISFEPSYILAAFHKLCTVCFYLHLFPWWGSLFCREWHCQPPQISAGSCRLMLLSLSWKLSLCSRISSTTMIPRCLFRLGPLTYLFTYPSCPGIACNSNSVMCVPGTRACFCLFDTHCRSFHPPPRET